MVSSGYEIETRLPVMEAFYTIQGEGYHQGKAAYFIRLGGCDVGCVWCDVKESWDAQRHPMKSVDAIVAQAEKESSPNGKKFAVVTGGEPLLYNLDQLTSHLRSAGFQTNLETSGSSPISGTWDWICLSPKKFKAPLPEVINLADELKVVVFNESDFDWAEKFAVLVPRNCKLFLQPEWERSQQMTPMIIEYIKQNPKWEFSLQLHNYINVP
jgi:7-carboxy-7-deazaguanine synthase